MIYHPASTHSIESCDIFLIGFYSSQWPLLNFRLQRFHPLMNANVEGSSRQQQRFTLLIEELTNVYQLRFSNLSQVSSLFHWLHYLIQKIYKALEILRWFWNPILLNNSNKNTSGCTFICFFLLVTILVLSSASRHSKVL